MGLIVVLLCCCFLRIDPSAPHSDELDAIRRAREAKYGPDFDLSALEQGGFGNIGFDNPGYQGQEDAISGFTTNTELSEKDEENSEGAKKRSKIRTNPHLSKESKIAKKAKKKAREKKEAEGCGASGK